MCRPLTLIAALCVALLIYIAIVALLIQRISSMIRVTVGRASSAGAPPVVRVEGGTVTILGRSAPLFAVVGAASIPPLWWLASVRREVRAQRPVQTSHRNASKVTGTKLTGLSPSCR